MSSQHFGPTYDTSPPSCKSCRTRGRMCNSCWSFSIGRSSIAIDPSSGGSAASNHRTTLRESTRSYRRILPKPSTMSRVSLVTEARNNETSIASGNSSDQYGLPADQIHLVRSANTTGPEAALNRQVARTHAHIGTYALPHIRTIIPPMDELGKAVQFIVSQHNRFVSQLALFKPKNVSFCLDAKRTASQLQSSQVMHWLLYLMCIIYREILDGDEKIYKRHHIRWVNRFEQRINSSGRPVVGPVAPMDSRRQLTAFIELSLLKHEVTETIGESYACLQAAAPAFLQLVFSEPSLWPQNSTSMMVPLARALVSSRGEINRFACTDVMSAIALGLPTLALYDTSLDGMRIPKFCAMEYVHGCPTEFVVILAEIHSWRLQHSGACGEEHWKSTEDRIKKLRQEGDESDQIPADSAQMIIRLAVKESWRHATLIYLYMNMCGARSDDPRVQASVDQVIKLIESIRPDTSYNTFFFLPYLFAGICAQKEQHRKYVMERFMAPLQMGWGLLRVSIFARVLEDLWRGVAVNGQGVTWNDYLCSRDALIPVRV